jgi:hypothetical protein
MRTAETLLRPFPSPAIRICRSTGRVGLPRAAPGAGELRIRAATHNWAPGQENARAVPCPGALHLVAQPQVNESSDIPRPPSGPTPS